VTGIGIKAIIFDFDGVILDTEMPEFQSWQEVFAEHGCELKLEVWAQAIGTAATAFDPYAHLASMAGAVDVDAIRARRRPRHAELIAAEAVLPGVRDWLEAARSLKLKLAVASSSPTDWVAGHLERLGLDEYFECLKCADHVVKTKPDPELYASVLEALGLSANEAMAVEDSPNGVRAAKAAGLFCVAVPCSLTRGLDLDAADMRLTSLAEIGLASLLAKLDR
jgi:HAD superfamily hydrolase (TIGR01509 family)